MILVSCLQIFAGWLLAVLFALLSLRLGYTWAIDKMKAIMAIEAATRHFRAVIEKIEFEEIWGSVEKEIGEVVSLDARRRATRVRMRERRPVA